MTEPVAWSDDFLTGNKSVDMQHKELVDMVNEFHAGVRTGGVMARVYFIKAIQCSVQYIKTHFTNEEALMQRGKYPSFDEHKGQHETFIAEVARQVHDIETEGNPDPADFVNFLTDWIACHIAVSDKKLAPYIANLE
jgi:hemerythrin-like metal-binding protein